MKQLKALNKYFWKYRLRLSIGILFVIVSNYFGVLAPQVTSYIIEYVQRVYNLPGYKPRTQAPRYDMLVTRFIHWAESFPAVRVVALAGIVILLLAVLRGFFMFLMRQTLIVMSRHIEYDQKNEVYSHYQKLDAGFFKVNSTGDLMSRMAEDVSRVRMFTGPAVMYVVNLITLISLAIYYMLQQDVVLTIYVLTPLPALAITIYFVNTIIHKRSEKLQAALAAITGNAQQSYAGIRVIKSFVQEDAMLDYFEKNSEDYKKQAVTLAKIEAAYFPSMTLFIGLSTLLTIMIGGVYYIHGTHNISISTIVEFVIYINLMTFPVSAIGATASMIQRASASQKRLNEFLQTEPTVENRKDPILKQIAGAISFEQVSFTYSNTGVQALKDFTLDITPGQKIAIVGRTGSGKTTFAQLLLRMYDTDEGRILIDGLEIKEYALKSLRAQISYVPQDGFLFSDTIEQNIGFSTPEVDPHEASKAAGYAVVAREIEQFPQKYQTMVGERGVTLSGGQKQRVSIARALLKDAPIIILDDCLSAVDARTEKEILSNLSTYLHAKTAIIITHRIFSLLQFDAIVVLEEGRIVETGTHQELIRKQGFYADMYARQLREERQG
jgi:ATP-binding cassette subfamily B multidrug efflux pump